MKKIFLIGCIMLFVLCATKKTTVETEGLEEVIVFGEEEEPLVIEEPVYPIEETEEPLEEVAEPEEVVELPPPIEEPIEEPYVMEEPIEEPSPIVEEAVVLAPAEEPLPPVVEETYVPPTMPPPTPPARVFGFRIQIFASLTEENAAKVASDARAAFSESVYVDYSAPYYKVRVGDCLTQEDGEILKNKSLRLGYRGAFVVETMIVP